MKLHVITQTFMAVLLSFAAISVASAQSSLCQVKVKGSTLAMDQRDDVRMKCMQQNKSKLNVKSCLQLANSMEYSNNAEDARMICLSGLKKQVKASECVAISNSMEYPDSGDDVRWECLRKFTRSAKKDCRKLAQKMSYPPNLQRALLYCDSELH